ncbi:hypothetical protein NPIL_154511 [Nephila pilipes]|uniref:Uncharacterized protein n=1 Tax=Nephila pilipes TaxID=299642 RepID=A0A8X6I2F6_NEPPI|nr:hypothetical protein NPIL_154511 [Nephila pilipes]
MKNSWRGEKIGPAVSREGTKKKRESDDSEVRISTTHRRPRKKRPGPCRNTGREEFRNREGDERTLRLATHATQNSAVLACRLKTGTLCGKKYEYST